MGGCFSQKRTDNVEAMSAEIDVSTAVERSAVNDLIQNGAEQVPAQGGSSEYVGAFMLNDTAQKHAVEPTVPVSNNQTEQPLPYVSSDVYQNRSEQIVDVPAEIAVKTSVDQPRNQIFEEQPMVQQPVYNQVIEEQPVRLPVPYNQIERTLPPVTSVVQHDYQHGNEPVFDVPIAAKVKTIVDQPLYHPSEAHPMVERTSRNQIMEEQPVMEHTARNQIYEEQPVHPAISGGHAVLPAQQSETQASVDVKENALISETQQPVHDLGVVFGGVTYRTRVFDPNLNEYVYVKGDDLQPRGGLVM